MYSVMSRGTTVCGCPRAGPQATVSAMVGVEYKSQELAMPCTLHRHGEYVTSVIGEGKPHENPL